MPPYDKYKKYIKNNTEYRNRPERKEFVKKYYTEYYKEMNVYIDCDCGATIKSLSMYNHVKSNKHINYLTS